MKKNVKVALVILGAMFVLGMAACSNASGDGGSSGGSSSGGTNQTGTGGGSTSATYTITFNANDGSAKPATATQTFTAETAQALKTISELGFSKSGFYFAGWLTSADASQVSYMDGSNYTATADATLYAFWSAIPVYKVNVATNENGTVTPSPTAGVAGTEITLSNSPAAGYKFVSYTVTAEDGSPVALTENKFKMPAQNVTVTAAFAALPSAASGEYKEIGTQTINGVNYGIVTFGLWPQTIKADGIVINQSETKTAGDFTYCRGSDGEWYAKIRENACGSNYKYSDGTTVAQSSANSYKWFKVEPIKWRVLTTNYGGKKLLFAENILIGKRYDASKNNYQNSEIRKWLNSNANSAAASDHSGSEGFLKTAFTAAEQSAIAATSVVNNARSTNTDANASQFNSGTNPNASATPTTDKVFLLSQQEVTTSAYGFDVYDASGTGNKRIRITTDCAKASGAIQHSTDGYGGWWCLRSAWYDVIGKSMWHISYLGNSNGVGDVYDNRIGVVPALCVSN